MIQIGHTGKPSEDRQQRIARTRRRILRGTSALPALFTILNGLAGFASIHYSTKDGLGQASISNLNIAAWLIGAALLCDMLDGRLARLARKTSDFGAQLDSLSDIVSFGVAPAMLMLRTVITVLRDNIERIEFLPDFIAVERLMWCIAAMYLACVGLRLARFNVETEADEASHMNFKGLPSPAAAAGIAALVLLFVNLAGQDVGWQASAWLLAAVSVTLPVFTLVVAMLMVSSVNYPHVVNQYIRGKRSFGYLVKLTVLVVAAFLQPYITLALVAVGYVVTGAVRAAFERRRRRRQVQQEEPAGDPGG